MEKINEFIEQFNTLPVVLRAMICSLVTCILFGILIAIFGPGVLVLGLFFAMITVVFYMVFDF